MKNVEVRQFNCISLSSRANGESFYGVLCPFCNSEVKMQSWSFRSIGKKCDCGAVLRDGEARREIGKGNKYDLLIYGKDGTDYSGVYEILRGGKVIKIQKDDLILKIPAEEFFAMVLKGKIYKL